MTSKQGQFKWGDLWSVLKTTGLMYGLPAVLFVTQAMMDWNFGDWTLVVNFGLGIFAKFIQKLMQENKY